MSRFVAAGTTQDSENPVTTEGNDAWAKAKQQIDEARNSKLTEKGRQEDGKSLYEVLQANKAAKQEAFEEATRLRNQFRPLDDSEIEFLDSVRDSERAKVAAAEKDTAEQLDVFRKQRIRAEQDALKKAQEAGGNTETDYTTKDIWTTSRKRRRGVDNGDIPPVSKQRKPSSGVNDALQPEPKLVEKPSSTTAGAASKQSPPDTTNAAHTSTAGLGLAAYESDSDGD